jgi:hypothetical protein
MSDSKGTNGEQYSPLFYNLLEDHRLKMTHVALYGFIWSLGSQRSGVSFAGNDHYMKMLNLKSRAVTDLIGHLEACGYVERWYDWEGGKKTRRYLRVLGTHQNADSKDQCAVERNSVCSTAQISMHETADIIDNLIDNKIDNIGDESPKEVISKNSYNFLGESYLKDETPTVEQVIRFYKSTGNGLNCKSNAEYFHAYWTERDWKRGSKKVQWPKTLNTWIASSKARGK